MTFSECVRLVSGVDDRALTPFVAKTAILVRESDAFRVDLERVRETMTERTPGVRAVSERPGAGHRLRGLATGVALGTPRRVRGLAFRSLIVALAFTGCQKDPVGSCDPCRTTALAYGSIRDSAGSPVPKVQVYTLAYLSGTCDGLAGGELLHADSQGNYRGLLSSLYSPFTANCFKITLNPDSTPPGPTFILHDSVQFRFEPERHGESQDSVRLDVVVAPGP